MPTLKKRFSDFFSLVEATDIDRQCSFDSIAHQNTKVHNLDSVISSSTHKVDEPVPEISHEFSNQPIAIDYVPFLNPVIPENRFIPPEHVLAATIELDYAPYSLDSNQVILKNLVLPPEEESASISHIGEEIKSMPEEALSHTHCVQDNLSHKIDVDQILLDTKNVITSGNKVGVEVVGEVGNNQTEKYDSLTEFWYGANYVQHCHLLAPPEFRIAVDDCLMIFPDDAVFVDAHAIGEKDENLNRPEFRIATDDCLMIFPDNAVLLDTNAIWDNVENLNPPNLDQLSKPRLDLSTSSHVEIEILGVHTQPLHQDTIVY